MKAVYDLDKAEFTNILSNDPSTKVCTLFGLLHQAVNIYFKQLKHLMLDNCPRRLDVLVNYISRTVEMCVRKRIFHKDDVLIVRLQEKTKLLSKKLQEIKETRKQNLELYIKPKNPERIRKKKNPLAPMTLEMYNSKLADKQLRRIRSKVSIDIPGDRNQDLKQNLVSPRKEKKKVGFRKKEFKAVKAAPTAEDLRSAKSMKIETQIEKFTDDMVSFLRYYFILIINYFNSKSTK